MVVDAGSWNQSKPVGFSGEIVFQISKCKSSKTSMDVFICCGILLSTILPCVVGCTSQLVHPVYKASPDWIAICRTGGLVASLCKFNTWPQGKDWGCFVAEARDSTFFF